ncbi:tetratricopeptide repeat protein [Streptomyces purpurogeneiscleroticus]|uniref:tetratricopeptide repeat protein n=1 Tax=Streptomyces purpurogeneiscleroticus TaxID=68259 RepID=UPI001CC01BCB|nr:tetratricopeptide repeat protein [Streptomyces purpurogeneiscleroticus]MBZ4015877.1 ATP/GTP-binding protein [Streptomyces purpurogeneiscleroticus]
MNGSNDAWAEGQGRVYQASGDQHIIEHHHHGTKDSDAHWPGLDSVRWPSVGRVPVALRDRTDLMGRLRAAVDAEAGGQVYVLHGLGGCGKTAVAHALFQYATDEADRVGLWVNASDTASLRTGMLGVAADRGAGHGELTAARSGLRAPADLVWNHLDRSPEPWLLVLDNADDPSVLRDGGWLRTSLRGTVLVTTRQAAAHWWPGAELLHVDVLPKQDAARVLCDLAPTAGTFQEAQSVAERLGQLPLALTLAGGFLAHQVIDPWTMADYGRSLDSGQGLNPIDLLDQGAATAGRGESRHLVSSTWQLSLDALVRHGVPEADPLLQLLACWTSDPLPLSLLSGLDMGDVVPRHRVELALRGLLDQSLTQVVPGEVRCLRTHGVLLDSVWHGARSEDRDRLIATAARQLLSVLPEIPQPVSQLDARTGLLAPHAVGLLQRATADQGVSSATIEAAAEALLRLVTALHRAGDYAPALTLAEQAVKLATLRVDPMRPVMLRLRRRKGMSLGRLGRFQEAEVVHRQELQDCERVCGPTSLDAFDGCLQLSKACMRVGKMQEAETLIERAVRGRTDAVGATHPLTIRARLSLVELRKNSAAGRRLVEDCHRVLEQDHSLALGAELNYAFALYESGREHEALAPARSAFAAYQRVLGPEYPITLAARLLLGRALAANGHREEALEHFAAVVEGRMRTAGPEHPWTVMAQDDLASLRGEDA